MNQIYLLHTIQAYFISCS